MKTIEYSVDGQAFADAVVEEKARQFLASTDENYTKVSTENFVLAIRVLIHEDVISCSEVEFKYQDLSLKPNSNGRLTYWPLGFCDVNENLLNRLLKGNYV